jgi:hypothetical protein
MKSEHTIVFFERIVNIPVNFCGTLLIPVYRFEKAIISPFKMKCPTEGTVFDVLNSTNVFDCCLQIHHCVHHLLQEIFSMR